MSIQVQSFLRKENGTLIPIHEWEEPIDDHEYLEGALSLAINGIPLITPSMWDYIDELWAYILNTIEEFSSSGSAHTYFPDQPINLEMKRINPTIVRVSISSKSGRFDNSTQVQEGQLIRELLNEGESFFKKMQELDPGGNNQYDYEIERFKEFRSNYSK